MSGFGSESGYGFTDLIEILLWLKHLCRGKANELAETQLAELSSQLEVFQTNLGTGLGPSLFILLGSVQTNGRRKKPKYVAHD